MSAATIPRSFIPSTASSAGYAPPAGGISAMPSGSPANNAVPFSRGGAPTTSNNIVPINRSIPAPNSGIAPAPQVATPAPQSIPTGGSRVLAPTPMPQPRPGGLPVGVGSSAVAAGVGAAINIAAGGDPGVAIGGALGSVAGTAIGGAIGNVPGAIIGGILGQLAGQALGGAISKAFDPSLNPRKATNSPSTVPINTPSGGMQADGLYRISWNYHFRFTNEPSNVFPYPQVTNQQVLGSNIASTLAAKTWDPETQRLDSISVTLVSPGTQPAQPFPSFSPALAALPAVGLQGTPQTASPSPEALPGLAPLPTPLLAPGSLPATAPTSNPSLQPTPALNPTPNPGRLPTTAPTPTPGRGRTPSPAPSTPAQGSGSSPPSTPQTPTRRGDCCEPSPMELSNNDMLRDVADAVGNNSLADLMDLLDQIMDRLPAPGGGNGGGEEEPPPEPTTESISVPVFLSCGAGGIAQTGSISLVVPKDLSAAIKRVFEQLKSVQERQCKTHWIVQRGYAVLGGDTWFPGELDLTPRRKDRFDTMFKNIAGSAFQQQTGAELEQESVNLLDFVRRCFGSTYYRTGIHEFPTEVAETLTSYSDDKKSIQIRGLSGYLSWFIEQFDLLLGQFPIEIEIEDIDPVTKGNQIKRVELPNLSEALAELYGLAISGSTNADLAINFLMRLSAETMATKNAALITQDYAKANAAFLGYKGNAKKREIEYSFDPTKLDSLEDFLQNTKGYLTGWGEEDKETVVGFLQRLMFSAGIIKAVFMRNSGQVNQLLAEIKSLLEGGDDEEAWKEFIQMINDPVSPFNQDVASGEYPLSNVDNKPVPGKTDQT